MGKLALEHVAFVILMILTFHNFKFQNFGPNSQYSPITTDN